MRPLSVGRRPVDIVGANANQSVRYRSKCLNRSIAARLNHSIGARLKSFNQRQVSEFKRFAMPPHCRLGYLIKCVVTLREFRVLRERSCKRSTCRPSKRASFNLAEFFRLLIHSGTRELWVSYIRVKRTFERWGHCLRLPLTLNIHLGPISPRKKTKPSQHCC